MTAIRLRLCFVLAGVALTLCIAGARADERDVNLLELAKNRLKYSVYGNAHYMDHSGLPMFSRPGGKLHDLDRSFWQWRELSLFLDYTVTDGVLASVELEAGDDFSQMTTDYAYLEFDIPTLFSDWDADHLGGLTLRAGKILVPFLSYNENKPSFKQVLMSQPFTASHIVPVIPSPTDFEGLGWSDIGATVNWYKEFGDVGIFDLKVGVIQGIGSEAEDSSGNAVLDANSVALSTGPTVRPRDGLIQNEQQWGHDNNSEAAFVTKVSYLSTRIPLDVGISWYGGTWDNDGNKDLEMIGLHANYITRDWTLKAEWVEADVEQTAGTNLYSGIGPASVNTSTGDYSMNAWFIEGSYIPLRYGVKEDRYVRLIGRFDEVDTNDKAAFTPFDKERMTYGLEWQFCPNARLRYEWQFHTIHDFDRRPGPFYAAGGRKEIEMQMISLIFWY